MRADIELPEYALSRLERYRPLLGAEWETFLDALRRPLPVCAWRNAARLSTEQFETWFREVEPDVALERLPWFERGYRLWARGRRRPDPRPGNRLARALGLLHLQEEVSMVPAVLLDPRPGERVLDLCGAPGNKTALIASLMEDRGTVICNDTDRTRLQAGRPAWERLGLSCIAASSHDGGSFPGEPAAYDRVLVDAPCSGEGTSRRNVSALRPGPPGYYRMLHGRQRRILTRAIELCRPGGRVVYSTCTYAPEENELVIADVLREVRRRGHAAALRPARIEGLDGGPGITAWEGAEPGTALAGELAGELHHALRIWPHQNDSGGFFVAVLEKAGADAGGAG
ncbi:MAG: RsmB/NOP family class I SAM-dependent RNA methyltransferase, partial [Spirochaetaceae bacterium]